MRCIYALISERVYTYSRGFTPRNIPDRLILCYTDVTRVKSVKVPCRDIDARIPAKADLKWSLSRIRLRDCTIFSFQMFFWQLHMQPSKSKCNWIVLIIKYFSIKIRVSSRVLIRKENFYSIIYNKKYNKIRNIIKLKRQYIYYKQFIIIQYIL